MRTRRILHGNTLLPIAGAKAYAPVISRLNKGEVLQIVPEPTNPYDKNAMRIIDARCQTVGYLPAAIAARVTGDLGSVPMVARVEELTQHDGVQVGARISIQAILDVAA